MKLIEALKEQKYQLKKAEDLITKIQAHSADLNVETPVYPNQKEMVDSWVQSHNDCLKRALYLNFCILKTNVTTRVSITIGGITVEKTIAEWIFRRKKLIQMEVICLKSLNDRNLKEGMINQSNGTPQQVHIRRYYDPKTRDARLLSLHEEPSLIDSKLEIVNCVTDLIES